MLLTATLSNNYGVLAERPRDATNYRCRRDGVISQAIYDSITGSELLVQA